MLGVAVGLFVGQQAAIRRLDLTGGEALVRRVIFFVATAVLVGVALHFRRFAGAWLIAAGIALNFVPMAAHGGLMPISYEVVRDSGAFPSITRSDIGRQIANSKDIVLERDDIHFYALSDRFVRTVPLYGTNIYSPGDFVIVAGVGLAAAQALLLLAFGVQPAELGRRAFLSRRRRPAG